MKWGTVNDGFSLSNLVHENYLEYNEDIHAIAQSAEAISFGETIFSDTYESSRTFLPDAHCLHSLCIPGYYSKSNKINKNLINDINENQTGDFQTLDITNNYYYTYYTNTNMESLDNFGKKIIK